MDNLEFYNNWYKSQHSSSILLYPVSVRFITGQLYPISFNNIQDDSSYSRIIEFYGFSQYNAYLNNEIALFEKNRKELDLIIERQSIHAKQELKNPPKLKILIPNHKTGMLVSLQWSNKLHKQKILDTRVEFLNKLKNKIGLESNLFTIIEEFDRDINLDINLLNVYNNSNGYVELEDQEIYRKLYRNAVINSSIINTYVIQRKLGITNTVNTSHIGEVRLSKILDINRNSRFDLNLSKNIPYDKNYATPLNLSTLLTSNNLEKVGNINTSIISFEDYNKACTVPNLDIETTATPKSTTLEMDIKTSVNSKETSKVDFKILNTNSEFTMSEDLVKYRQSSKLINFAKFLRSDSTRPEVCIKTQVFCAMCNTVSITNTPIFKLQSNDNKSVSVHTAIINTESANIPCIAIDTQIDFDKNPHLVDNFIMKLLTTNIRDAKVVISNFITDKLYHDVNNEIVSESYRKLAVNLDLMANSPNYFKKEINLDIDLSKLFMELNSDSNNICELVSLELSRKLSKQAKIDSKVLIDKVSRESRFNILKDLDPSEIQIDLSTNSESYRKLKKIVHQEIYNLVTHAISSELIQFEDPEINRKVSNQIRTMPFDKNLVTYSKHLISKSSKKLVTRIVDKLDINSSLINLTRFERLISEFEDVAFLNKISIQSNISDSIQADKNSVKDMYIGTATVLSKICNELEYDLQLQFYHHVCKRLESLNTRTLFESTTKSLVTSTILTEELDTKCREIETRVANTILSKLSKFVNLGKSLSLNIDEDFRHYGDLETSENYRHLNKLMQKSIHTYALNVIYHNIKIESDLIISDKILDHLDLDSVVIDFNRVGELLDEMDSITRYKKLPKNSYIGNNTSLATRSDSEFETLPESIKVIVLETSREILDTVDIERMKKSKKSINIDKKSLNISSNLQNINIFETPNRYNRNTYELSSEIEVFNYKKLKKFIQTEVSIFTADRLKHGAQVLSNDNPLLTKYVKYQLLNEAPVIVERVLSSMDTFKDKIALDKQEKYSTESNGKITLDKQEKYSNLIDVKFLLSREAGLCSKTADSLQLAKKSPDIHTNAEYLMLTLQENTILLPIPSISTDKIAKVATMYNSLILSDRSKSSIILTHSPSELKRKTSEMDIEHNVVKYKVLSKIIGLDGNLIKLYGTNSDIIIPDSLNVLERLSDEIEIQDELSTYHKYLKSIQISGQLKLLTRDSGKIFVRKANEVLSQLIRNISLDNFVYLHSKLEGNSYINNSKLQLHRGIKSAQINFNRNLELKVQKNFGIPLNTWSYEKYSKSFRTINNKLRADLVSGEFNIDTEEHYRELRKYIAVNSKQYKLDSMDKCAIINIRRTLLDSYQDGYQKGIYIPQHGPLLDLDKRWYFMPSDGPYDKLILPNDYPYATQPLGPYNKHPFPGSDKATEEILVDINIMTNVIDFCYELWYTNSILYTRLTPKQTISHFVNALFDWLDKYLPNREYKLPEYYPEDYSDKEITQESREDYWRLYKWIRWYAEAKFFNVVYNLENSINGNPYIDELLEDLAKYVNDHHGIYGVPGTKVINKVKGVRHKWLKHNNKWEV